jgi:hypothetical protein
LRVSPFSKRGLDESLRLSVCLRRVGFREDLSQTCSCAGGAEGLRPVARTVVRHHAFDVDPEPGEVSSGGHQEGDSALLALVWHDLHESDARGVVNADVDVFPTDAMVTIDDASRSSSDAMPDRADAPELLDVEVDQFAWMVALIAPDRLCRLEGRELVEAEPQLDERLTLKPSSSRVSCQWKSWVKSQRKSTAGTNSGSESGVRTRDGLEPSASIRTIRELGYIPALEEKMIRGARMLGLPE